MNQGRAASTAKPTRPPDAKTSTQARAVSRSFRSSPTLLPANGNLPKTTTNNAWAKCRVANGSWKRTPPIRFEDFVADDAEGDPVSGDCFAEEHYIGLHHATAGPAIRNHESREVHVVWPNLSARSWTGLSLRLRRQTRARIGRRVASRKP